jgi:hypothetical protein
MQPTLTSSSSNAWSAGHSSSAPTLGETVAEFVREPIEGVVLRLDAALTHGDQVVRRDSVDPCLNATLTADDPRWVITRIRMSCVASRASSGCQSILRARL